MRSPRKAPDTSTWNVGVLDAEAAFARSANGKVFVYGGHVQGVRAYARDGTRLFQALETETLHEPEAFVYAADDRLLVVTRVGLTGYRIRALNPARGNVLIDARDSGQIIEMVSVK